MPRQFRKNFRVKKNVSQVVKKNLCCGCGVCSSVCPTKAIKIVFNKKREYHPIIDTEKCIECEKCLKVCSFSEENLLKSIKDPEKKATESVISVKRGFIQDKDDYMNSASGGLLNTLLSFLLESGEIDSVIHVESCMSPPDGKFFSASISRTVQQIKNKRGSVYYPISFEEVLKKIMEDKNFRNVAIVGVPCAVSAIKKLSEVDNKYAKKIKFIFGLVCSHNVNGNFAKYLIRKLIKENGESKIIFRDKREIEQSESFNNTVITKSNKVSVNRHKYFTNSWRGFFFSLNSCLYCTDFFGNNADASFKDAWGFKNLVKKGGESVVIIRNEKINKVFEVLEKRKIVHVCPLSIEELVKSQESTFSYKTKNNKQHIHELFNLDADSCCAAENILINFDFSLKKLNQFLSMKLFKSGNRLLKIIIDINSILLKITDIAQLGLNIIEKERVKKIYLTKGKTDIVYTAGFMGSNVGDEAQLLANLELWKSLAPEKKITILSPNPDHTIRYGKYEIIRASRNCFFGFKNVPYAGIGESKLFNPYFFLKYISIRINSMFLKYFNMTVCNRDATLLLKKLKEAEVLHVGGGGFITGKTPSRLFDYMALIKLAKYFKTDVILTGQTIGVWKKKSHKKWAKNLGYAKLIGLRDQKQSREDLRKIGINEDKIFNTFDDALFLKTKTLKSKKKYVVVNAHFWNTNYSAMKENIKKIATICDYINDKGYEIYLVSMSIAPSDKEALFAIKTEMKRDAIIFEDIQSPKDSVLLIKNASFCITMKHHPIIFAMAGGVPTISLYYDGYYKHKNMGAMSLFGQEKFTFELNRIETKIFKDAVNKVVKNRQEISKQIKEKIKEYEKNEGCIIKSFLKSKE